MRSRRPKAGVFVGVLMLLLAGAAVSAQKKRPWRTGSLMAVSASGYGKTDRGRGDLWWKYCIRSGDRTYAGAVRRSPAKMGLAVGDPVKFALAGNRVYVLDKDGREQVMHLQNKDTESDCGPRPPEISAPPP